MSDDEAWVRLFEAKREKLKAQGKDLTWQEKQLYLKAAARLDKVVADEEEKLAKVQREEARQQLRYEKDLAGKRRYISDITRARLLDSQECLCFYCEEPFSEEFEPQVEHVKPISKGGSSEMWNLVVACEACNAIKGDTDYGDEHGQVKAAVRAKIRQRYAKVCLVPDGVQGAKNVAEILQREVPAKSIQSNAQNSLDEFLVKRGFK